MDTASCSKGGVNKMAKQKLLTKEVAKAIPVLGSTEGEDNPSIVVKFFNPANQWTWYAIEGTAYLKDGREVAVAEVPNLDTLEGVDDIHFFGQCSGVRPTINSRRESETHGSESNGESEGESLRGS